MLPIAPCPRGRDAGSVGPSARTVPVPSLPSLVIWRIPACPKYLPGLGGATSVTPVGKESVRGGDSPAGAPGMLVAVS